MPKSRSPRYPAIGLTEAIEAVEKLYRAEKRTPVSAGLIAKAWGYKGISGSVLIRIGALRQYGLLDGGKDHNRVSDLAVEILAHPKDSSERRAAIARAALNPALFAELSSQLPDASDDALKAYLITRKGFGPEGAARCVASYRDALSVFNESQSADAIHTHLSVYDGAEKDSAVKGSFIRSGATLFPPSVHQTLPQAPGSLIFRIPFRGAELTVRIEVSGQKLTKEHIAKVRGYLQLMEEDLEPSAPDTDPAEPKLHGETA